MLFIVFLPIAFSANTTIDSTTPRSIAGVISNTSVNNGDTINLQPGTYNKTNQHYNITINKSITIKGNRSTQNVIIDAQNISQIFAIADNINVTFINITFINADSLTNGGAIYNQYLGTMMTFINCTFADNKAAGYSGAIYNVGSNLNVSNSNFNNNSANYGGAIMNTGNMSVSNNTMIGNSANLGQMIYNLGDIGILNLTFINNSTIIVKKGQNISLFATLVDDVGNTLTGQNISFYINGTLLEIQQALKDLLILLILALLLRVLLL